VSQFVGLLIWSTFGGARFDRTATAMRGGESFNTAGSGRPTLDDQLNVAGLGWYQGRLFFMLSLIVVADGMEMTVRHSRATPAHARTRARGSRAGRAVQCAAVPRDAGGVG